MKLKFGLGLKYKSFNYILIKQKTKGFVKENPKTFSIIVKQKAMKFWYGWNMMKMKMHKMK